MKTVEAYIERKQEKQTGTALVMLMNVNIIVIVILGRDQYVESRRISTMH